jgi:hypothetical protein
MKGYLKCGCEQDEVELAQLQHDAFFKGSKSAQLRLEYDACDRHLKAAILVDDIKNTLCTTDAIKVAYETLFEEYDEGEQAGYDKGSQAPREL